MIYRKRGYTVRWENGTLIRVSESGAAYDEEPFRCHPERSEEPAPFDPRSVLATAGALARLRPERLIVTEGVAEHRYGERRWTERTQRVHIALTDGRERTLIDQAHFDTAHIERVAAALARAEREQPQPPQLRLGAGVAAALLPALVDLAPPNVRVVQTSGGIDGKGQDIVEAEGDWPNWYRPSYRIRPAKTPLNLRVECDVTEIDATSPIAVALLAPVHGLSLRVLVEDGPRVYPSTIRLFRIGAVATERTWYPYGAGSFGAEMML